MKGLGHLVGTILLNGCSSVDKFIWPNPELQLRKLAWGRFYVVYEWWSNGGASSPPLFFFFFWFLVYFRLFFFCLIIGIFLCHRWLDLCLILGMLWTVSSLLTLFWRNIQGIIWEVVILSIFYLSNLSKSISPFFLLCTLTTTTTITEDNHSHAMHKLLLYHTLQEPPWSPVAVHYVPYLLLFRSVAQFHHVIC